MEGRTGSWPPAGTPWCQGRASAPPSGDTGASTCANIVCAAPDTHTSPGMGDSGREPRVRIKVINVAVTLSCASPNGPCGFNPLVQAPCPTPASSQALCPPGSDPRPLPGSLCPFARTLLSGSGERPALAPTSRWLHAEPPTRSPLPRSQGLQ
ncbi:hypothetical protein P7K49_013193 [Saguinus oedipus]|uniref:Uncharacterized protein n=1 Tax=Saguinus oedipus TaxID=9490 RepID=A0ABQ9VFB4_SAGOE|nr:hypothetical protein P7K49_013193 [Saguinus oedipus]